MLDEGIAGGWDAHGVHCWSMHKFESLEFVEDNSEHICLVDRKMRCGWKVSQNFRKYLNSAGETRFVMLDLDNAYAEGGEVVAHITDAPFFASFVSGMYRCGEISREDYDALSAALGGLEEPVDAEGGCSSAEIPEDELAELENL